MYLKEVRATNVALRVLADLEYAIETFEKKVELRGMRKFDYISQTPYVCPTKVAKAIS